MSEPFAHVVNELYYRMGHPERARLFMLVLDEEEAYFMSLLVQMAWYGDKGRYTDDTVTIYHITNKAIASATDTTAAGTRQNLHYLQIKGYLERKDDSLIVNLAKLRADVNKILFLVGG